MEKIQKGKKLLFLIILGMLLLDAVIIFMNAGANFSIGKFDRGIATIIEGTIRFFITGALLFFVYKGKSWAKWIIVALLLFGSAIAFLLGNKLTVIFGIIYTSFCIMLMFSSSIKAFLAYQNQ